jgi:hypothetical protein
MFGKQVRLQPADESRLYRYQLSVGDLLDTSQLLDPGRVLPPEERASQRVVAGWELYHADSLVLTPKLRYSAELGGLSGAVALIGDSLLRCEDRDLGGQRVRHHRLADLLELADPDLVVSDGVEVGWGGGSLCQSSRPLGFIVVADNAVAHDVVCAHLVGFDPEQSPYLVAAGSRGYGPLSLDAIDLVSEVDFDVTALRLAGYGPGAPKSVSEFRSWYQRRTGFALGLEVIACDPRDAGTAARLLSWLMASWDHPRSREDLKGWPELSLMVGVNEEGPRYPRVALLGDRAVSDFSRHCASQHTVIEIPQILRRSFGGISKLMRFRRRDGQTGWAVAVPGTPPSLREISVALWLFSFGRVRSPLLRLEGPLDRLVFRFLAFLKRRRKNSKGIPVVHARKIARLAGRPWRRLWGQPQRLKLRSPSPPKPPASDPGGAA